MLVSLLRSEYLSLLEVIFTIDITHKVHEQVIGMETIFFLTLIECDRAGAWHYRIFPDFLNSGLKMASKIEGKTKVIACS